VSIGGEINRQRRVVDIAPSSGGGPPYDLRANQPNLGSEKLRGVPSQTSRRKMQNALGCTSRGSFSPQLHESATDQRDANVIDSARV